MFGQFTLTKHLESETGVSNQWNGIWTGMWNGMVEWNYVID